MKQHYHIKEISKMYQIGIDSLRYYEKIGLLSPKRDDNGYRLYTLSDIYKLNIICDLKSLHVPMKQIKEYMDVQSIETTNQLLVDEIVSITKQLESLKKKQKCLKLRQSFLQASQNNEIGKIICKELPERKCVQFTTRLTTNEESDYAMKKLHGMYAHMLQDLFDQNVGSIIHMKELPQEELAYTVYSSIFFILDEHVDMYDFLLPKGYYLSLYYRGDYNQTPSHLQKLLSYAKAHGYEILEEPIELCHIDNRHTKYPEEFMTELQLHIKK